MKKFFIPLIVCLFNFWPLFADCFGESRVNPVPVPPAERGLPSEVARTWVVVAPENNILEGAIFDADGDLLFLRCQRAQDYATDVR